ncbi:unnamed protein product [Vitrella brassicaformis CCMP3155]|uniref:Orn/Lys/Arg decarboxylases family 1 pyridoxal-P attachment site domain-containing protein n=2 Tax=Vitrella brassicaformis TaxID=1169539 RepID=A0A0G4EB82_VITBC|nr:unnamed protein product [Vitrella brassicaformis CCMP3155]|mmetsp:Transcript_47986/g.120095  ORF Transcript_47986/g.120095 Transcript_47986/m.120095 type:complete len:1017 (+) Transcript_47986:102-3152(+)|eukprot:CEL92524.1 unnamed protein product [Vitrella brassicaformis CCMP3155]
MLPTMPMQSLLSRQWTDLKQRPFRRKLSRQETSQQLVSSVEQLESMKDCFFCHTLRYELWEVLVNDYLPNHNLNKTDATLSILDRLEGFWGDEMTLSLETLRMLVRDDKWTEAQKNANKNLKQFTYRHLDDEEARPTKYCVMVIVAPLDKGDITRDVGQELRSMMHSKGGPPPYNVVTCTSVEEALLCVLINSDIQAIVVQDLQHSINCENANAFVEDFRHLVEGYDRFVAKPIKEIHNGASIHGTLLKAIKMMRPEIHLYTVTHSQTPLLASGKGQGTLAPAPFEEDERYVDSSGDFDPSIFINREFCQLDGHLELHDTIVQGVKEKQACPFFDALKRYAEKPIGVFHALAISRGNSIHKSRWIGHFMDFYGMNLFKAESSSTCGGLDSLLEPHGAIKDAQELAAKTFGAHKTFFVTNGTSTANKIVLQAVLKPNDVVLVDRDCHKSHHYGMVLTGARPCYLDAYPLHDFSMYGGVPLETIKRTLLAYKAQGRLMQVKLLVLTNCTFDGIVINVQRVMEECLAIKPDLIFLFDEAWYAYAYFHPIYRLRTGMGAANILRHNLRSSDGPRRHTLCLQQMGVDSIDEASNDVLMNTRLFPDPAHAVVRVYATQSTHKSLTALRQGSMIHVNDDLFSQCVNAAFTEAYFTHTSTSPNYQILASLDVGRSQMALEGNLLVKGQIEAALTLRRHAAQNALIAKYFRILTVRDMIPSQHRLTSTVDHFYQEEVLKKAVQLKPSSDWKSADVRVLERLWLSDDEFVLDPTRITLYTGNSGIDGDTFKVKWLMEKYGIQVNKTSRNSVLFQTNIGTTSSAIMYLLQCLEKAALEIDGTLKFSSDRERELHQRRIDDMTIRAPPLPNFSEFHKSLGPPQPAARGKNNTHEDEGGEVLVRDGDLRTPYFLAFDESHCAYYDIKEALECINNGQELVATSFIIPYPPGFPVAVPGQVLSAAILEFLIRLDVKEVHGLNAELGLRCFRPEVLASVTPTAGPPAAVQLPAANNMNESTAHSTAPSVTP